jgi:DNA polymerase I
LRGSGVVKVETQLPKHVGEIRDDFDDPLEADVQFPTRFLVDMGIEQCFSVPADGDSRRITPDEITAIEGGETAHIDVDPHTLYFDIEVQQSTDGPAVVSERGTELAMNPITAIAAYDNYTDESHVWLLVHDSWDEEDGAAARKGARDADDDAFVWLYGTERELLQEFCQWVADRRFDVVTGWNSNGFDVPYLVNRCIKEKEIVEIYNWSPTRDVETMNGEGKWINSDLKGVILFDMLDGFEKTEYTELDSFALDDVAAEVVDATKVDVGHIDDAWANRPHDFAKYVLRDTLLVREIDETRGILVGESQ